MSTPVLELVFGTHVGSSVDMPKLQQTRLTRRHADRNLIEYPSSRTSADGCSLMPHALPAFSQNETRAQSNVIDVEGYSRVGATRGQ